MKGTYFRTVFIELAIFTLAIRFTRRQCELFVTLPDPVDYSDYYLLIKKPIAMDMISHRLHSTYYTDIGDLVADFQLMFDNAMTYNQEGSQVYNDALSLKEAFSAKFNELCPGGQLFINDADRFAVNADQQASDRKRSREDRSEDEARPPLAGKKARVEEREEEEDYEDGGADNRDD
jgi:ATP-dependent helicase STH1/SNF2